MMADVHSEASKTIIWLGENADQSESAFALIRMLHLIIPNINKAKNYKHFSLMSEDLGSLPITAPHSLAWIAFGKLMERPWFRRSWVIQEAALAKRSEVMCGDQARTFERDQLGA